MVNESNEKQERPMLTTRAFFVVDDHASARIYITFDDATPDEIRASNATHECLKWVGVWGGHGISHTDSTGAVFYGYEMKAVEAAIMADLLTRKGYNRTVPFQL